MTDASRQLQTLIDGWCDRREYRLLAIVLSAWLANNGLTDGWSDLRDAVKSAYASGRHLPPDERETLKDVLVAIEAALQSR